MRQSFTSTSITSIAGLVLVVLGVICTPCKLDIAYGQELTAEELLQEGHKLHDQGDLEGALKYYTRASFYMPASKNDPYPDEAYRAKKRTIAQLGYASVDKNFVFNGEIIPPAIIREFHTWISDTGDQIVAINLTESVGSNRYGSGNYSKSRVLSGGQKHYYIEGEHASSGEKWSFGYTHIGRTTSGIHVVNTSDWGGGSGVFKRLMLFTIEMESTAYLVGDLTSDGGTPTIGMNLDRVVLKKLGEISLGDRYDGDLSVKGDTIMIGKDEGWFSVSGGTGGGYIKKPVEVVVEAK